LHLLIGRGFDLGVGRVCILADAASGRVTTSKSFQF